MIDVLIPDYHYSEHFFENYNIVHNVDDLTYGSHLFVVSWPEKISMDKITGYDHAIVLHASDLPKGRGWSPWVWDIEECKPYLTVSAVAMTEEIDAGPVYCKARVQLDDTELLPEIFVKICEAQVDLIEFIIQNDVVPIPQSGTPTYRERRTPENSRLDPDLTIAAQFDQMRAACPERWPSFFTFRGQDYILRLEKDDGTEL